MDVVRFIKVGEGETVGPVVLWIGVTPETLFGEDARTSTNGCLDLLKEFDITDVEVEFRDPLTPALGLSIAAEATPHVEGTGGIYLTEGGDSEKVLLITARHVLFPPTEVSNDNYTLVNSSMPRREVLLGQKAFSDVLKSIEMKINDQSSMADWCKKQITKSQVQGEAGEDKDDLDDEIERDTIELNKARKAKQALEILHSEVAKDWSQPNQRVIGHVSRSPPITFGAEPEGFTEDYAVVELDRAKIGKAFRGNVVDLGTKISPSKFTKILYPRTDGQSHFVYPHDRLLQLQDIILEDGMQNPDLLDKNGDPCLLVIKNGITTGVTIGRANGIFSYTRERPNKTCKPSKEWAIMPYDHKSGAFSELGDSGSVIVDGLGRIGGLLTGGSGTNKESLNVTYATPFFWLFDRIKKNGILHSHLYPVVR